MGTTEFFLLPCRYDSGFALLRGDRSARPIAVHEMDPARAAGNVGQPGPGGALTWADVDWDDSLTTLAWDRSCGFVVGCLALAAAVCRRLRPEADHPALYEGFPRYEFTSVVHWERADAPAARRYLGFHAEILEAGGVQVRQHLGARGARRVTVPRLDWTRCDPVDHGFSTLAATARPGDAGAVFLEPGYAQTLALLSPKLPYWE